MKLFNIKATNVNRNLSFDSKDYENKDFVLEYDGLNQPVFFITANDRFDGNGATFANISTGVREITLNYFINRNVGAIKESINAVFVTGEEIKIDYTGEKADSMTYSIIGTVTSVLSNRFNYSNKGKQLISVSVMCDNPLFNIEGADNTYEKAFSSNKTIITGIKTADGSTDDGEAVFKIKNDSSTHAVIQALEIKTQEGDATITLENVVLFPHGTLFINTDKKTITNVNSMGGIRDNLIGSWVRGSRWMRIKNKASNIVTITITASTTIDATATVEVISKARAVNG